MLDYLKHWNLRTPAFTGSADPKLVGSTSSLLEAGQRLVLGCEQHVPLMTLSGPAGSGKTTLAKWIYQTLDLARFEALLVSVIQAETTPGWLIPRLSAYAGEKSIKGEAASEHLKRTAQRLDDLRAEGRILAVIIDNCERLKTAESLEEIASLLDVQALCGQTMVFILVGSDAFAQTLGRHESLAARIGLHMKIPTPTLDVLRSIMEGRAQAAGLPARVFAEDAWNAMAECCGTNLHAWSNLAEAALVEGATQGQVQMDAAVIRAAATKAGLGADRSAVPPSPQPIRPARPASDPTWGLAQSQEIPPQSIALSSLFKKDRKSPDQKK